MGGRLDDKVAIVTGGGPGFGAEICRKFAEEGARDVSVLDVNEDGASQVAKEIAGADGRTRSMHCDVADRAQAAAAIRETIDAFGRIDVCVNNAGIMHRNQPLLEIDPSLFDRIFAVNVKAIHLSARSDSFRSTAGKVAASSSTSRRRSGCGRGRDS